VPYPQGRGAVEAHELSHLDQKGFQKMANARDVSHLLNQLHDKKVVNLDTSLRAVLAPEALDQLDPGGKVSTAVVAWDGYGLVIKGDVATIADVAALGQGIRQQVGTAAQKAQQLGQKQKE